MREQDPEATEAFREAVSLALFGRSRQEPACVTCGSERVSEADFRDAKSRLEFRLSRMCQACQDELFGACEEDLCEEVLAEAEIRALRAGARKPRNAEVSSVPRQLEPSGTRGTPRGWDKV